MGKVALFIDGGYFDKVLERHGRPRIDYQRFSDAAVAPDQRFRTYYYHGPPWQADPPTAAERKRFGAYQSFVQRLEFLDRFAVRQGRLQRIGDGFIQKGVDILLAVDMVRLAFIGKLDRVVLVSGDSDFVPAIEAVRDAGLTTTLLHAPEMNAHHSLVACVDERKPLTQGMLEEHRR